MTGKDLNSYHMVGTMYYYGIGVKANLKMAFEIFERCVNLKAPSCYNALGLMYQRGDYVKQDIIKAYSLFSSGSELGDSYSQFNQGSLLLVENGYRLHEDIEKQIKSEVEQHYDNHQGKHAQIEYNKKRALNLFALSAHQHHLPSLYILSLIHMEGHEHYSSCSLSSSLLSQVLARKNSQFYSKQVDRFFDGELLEPMMVFVEAAFLGRNDGLINAIALADKYGQQIFGKQRSLQEVIDGDKELAGFTPPEDQNDTVLRKVLRIFNLDNNKGIQWLEEEMFGDITRLLEGQTPVYKNTTNKIHHTLATNLMEHGVKYDFNMAYVRLGDYYYYGKHPDGVDHKKAFGLYKSSTWYNNSIDFQAQGYLSLGYMYQFGKGCERNLNSAREAYSNVNLFLFTNKK